MFRSPYVKQHNSEHKSRFMIDAIILDRLDHLDSGDSERLTWFYDVPLAVWSELKSQWILGRPSNCLMYGNQTKETHKALVVLEAKEHSETDITQLIIYLAAVQDARKKANNKLNGSVFGISTDAYGWQFLFLNSDRKLCVSPTISWLLQRSLVIQWIDQILQDAVRITA
ncbi:hypothetical protein F66182_11610 [Fusarium sp. NRRL 66182]|nr:hypothetical protein F66182_11610 [Fusarium sp. NRRL 66182]